MGFWRVDWIDLDRALEHWSKRAFWIECIALRGKSWVSLLGRIRWSG
jgi:hypothetical protein